jgi:hypothetical protein
MADKGRNAEVNFRGQKRSNETHASVTDPDGRLYRKGEGKEAKLCYMGHALMENRNGLVVEACLLRGMQRVGGQFIFTLAAHNLVRLPELLTA